MSLRISRMRFGVVVIISRGRSPLRKRRHQAFVKELKVADAGELIEPDEREVLAPDGVWFLGGEPADLGPVREEDLLPVLVVVGYFDAAALRLGDDARFALEADGADVIVGGTADADVDVRLGQGHLERPVTPAFVFPVLCFQRPSAA